METHLKTSTFQSPKLYSMTFYTTLSHSVRFPHQPNGGN